MLSTKMLQALNEHLNAEISSAYLYMSMSAYFDDQNLPGFSKWMQSQAKEELAHAMKFYGYINERNGRVTLAAVAAPKTAWETPAIAFDEVYAHERYISDRINKLVDLAASEGDHATVQFLQWFVGEQVEEESAAYQVVTRLKLTGAAPGGLFWVDRELAMRA